MESVGEGAGAGSENGQVRVPEVQGKASIQTGGHSASCELPERQTGSRIRDMVPGFSVSLHEEESCEPVPPVPRGSAWMAQERKGRY